MRKKIYTQRGLSRVPCFRCGEPSSSQWNACSLNNKYAGICTKCDTALNALVLKFMRVPNWEKIASEYRAEKKG